MNRKQQIIVSAAAVLALAAGASVAQGNDIKRELVQRADVSVPNREAVVARVEVPPGGVAGRHTHPGDEISYVLEGEGEVLFDGEPARKIKVGDAFIIPAGKIHAARSTGTVPLKLVGVYVVEKENHWQHQLPQSNFSRRREHLPGVYVCPSSLPSFFPLSSYLSHLSHATQCRMSSPCIACAVRRKVSARMNKRALR